MVSPVYDPLEVTKIRKHFAANQTEVNIDVDIVPAHLHRWIDRLISVFLIKQNAIFCSWISKTCKILCYSYQGEELYSIFHLAKPSQTPLGKTGNFVNAKGREEGSGRLFVFPFY